MSPEQPAGDPVTEKSDVYSLGVLAFQLVTGQPPFSGTSPMAVIAHHLRTRPPSVGTIRPDLHPQFAKLIDRCLAKDPAQRPTAAEIARYLLPPAQPVVEWPPPGLDPLRGAGSTLGRQVAWLAVLQLVVFALIYGQPTSSTGSWPDTERVWLWRTVWWPYTALDAALVRPTECSLLASVGEECPPARIEAAPLWSFTLTAVWVLVLGMAVRIGRRGRRVRAAYRRARAAGYTPPVLRWVMGDEYADTGALLSGSGPLALVPAAERMRIVERRRVVDRWVTYALLAAAVPPLLWLLGLLSIGGGGTRWLTGWEMLVFALPLAAALAIRVIDRRRAGGEAVPRNRGMSRAPLALPDVRPELVTAWLAGAPAHLTATRAAAYPNSAIATGFTVLVLLTTGMTLAGSWFFNVWTSPTTRALALDWLAQAGHTGDRFTHWAELDSVVGERIRLTPGSIGVNLAAGRYLWHSPYVEDHFRAGQVLNQALALEARRARAAGEGQAADAARETAAQISRYLLSIRLFFLGFEEALMADPRAPVGEPFLADPHQAPAVRRSLALAALSGFCYNGREMLFGLSEGRRALVAKAKAALPRMADVSEALNRGLRELDGERGGRRGLFGFFQRLAWCRPRFADSE